MALNPDNERKLRRNWSLLKQEIQVDMFLMKFVEDGVFPPSIRGEIMNVMPNTASMKAEKFLNAVIQSGNRGYDALCRTIMLNPDNRYARIIEVLGISQTNTNANANATAPTGNTAAARQPNTGNVAGANVESRPSTAVSSTSSGTINSETGEKHRRVRTMVVDNVRELAQSLPPLQPPPAPIAAIAPQIVYPTSNNRPFQTRSSTDEIPDDNTPQALFVESRLGESFIGTSRASQSEMSIASFNSDESDTHTVSTPQASVASQRTPQAPGREDTIVDMKVLEQELVRIAPTIADLFKKIAVQTNNIPTSEEELQKVKDENERLRKTNKSLIEKLNAFQQKIILLQLDNKKLKENGEVGNKKKDELKKKAEELQDMERRLDEHKKALEEKEQELNSQLLKLQEIEEENATQREKIDKLEELQDEGILERNIQQEQISTLVEEKEKQKDQIESLEEQQKIGEHRLFSLEERLKLLEQPPKRQGRNRRVMSPPRSNYWMNGVVDRSHHANVKYQSEIKFDPQRNGKRNGPTGKQGWPFI